MIDERLDVAFHRGDPLDSSLVSRLLGVFGDRVVASASYVEAHGQPDRPEELARHSRVLRLDVADPDVWRFDGLGGPSEVLVAGAFRANNGLVAQLVARDGQGVAMLPEILVADNLRTGRLVPLLPAYQSQRLPVHLVYPSRRNLPPRTRMLIDFVVEETKATAASLAKNCAAAVPVLRV